MVPSEHDGTWDFTPVIDLIYSLSAATRGPLAAHVARQAESEQPQLSAASPEQIAESSLGNFDKIWKYLGLPPENTTSDKCLVLEHNTTSLEDTDGAVEVLAEKGVRWRDDLLGADLEDSDVLVDGTDVTKLSKSQRKKERRRKKHLEEQHTRLKSVHDASSSESEAAVQDRRLSLDRRAVIQNILYGTKITSDRSSLGPQLLPSSVSPRRLPLDSAPTKKWPVSSPFVLKHSDQHVQRIEQNIAATAAAKKARLMSKLLASFQEDSHYLSNLDSFKSVDQLEGNAREGIHVFVDASNIMIGFHDTVKVARGLSTYTRIPRQPLSFHSLSLILERGRPVTKRVLVGSDNFPAIQEAKSIGYETNILERVHKAKELTPRQKKFRNGNTTSGASSGSETNATHAREKWVEQAVDEILHLKILESVVDTNDPTTIVLATGDAAEAEYSQGFLKMAERALHKGWKVELVSFKHNTSWAYKNKEFRARWAQQFSVIELDEFVEELLDS